MKDWVSAGAQVRRRSFRGLLNSLSITAVFTFRATDSLSEVTDFLDANWELLNAGPDVLLDLPARDVNFVRDCLISICKFLHVVECSRAQFNRGALTWTLVDAYHASLLGARALCALFGVLCYTVKGRTILVDFRPEFGSVDQMKIFRKQNRNSNELVRILQPQSRLLEQKDTWSILKRLCNVCDPLEGDEDSLAGISKICDMSLSKIRNLILYDSVFWSWREDFGRTETSRENLVQAVSDSDDAAREILTSVTEIFNLVTNLTNQFCSAVGVKVSTLSAISSLIGGPNVIVAV